MKKRRVLGQRSRVSMQNIVIRERTVIKKTEEAEKEEKYFTLELVDPINAKVTLMLETF